MNKLDVFYDNKEKRHLLYVGNINNKTLYADNLGEFVETLNKLIHIGNLLTNFELIDYFNVESFRKLTNKAKVI